MKTFKDAMVDAALAFSEAGSYLSHPKVRPYLGSENGDSIEAWRRDYTAELCRSILAVAQPEERRSDEHNALIESINELYGVYVFPEDLEIFWDRVSACTAAPDMAAPHNKERK